MQSYVLVNTWDLKEGRIRENFNKCQHNYDKLRTQFVTFWRLRTDALKNVRDMP